jgi:hypothetical protein
VWDEPDEVGRLVEDRRLELPLDRAVEDSVDDGWVSLDSPDGEWDGELSGAGEFVGVGSAPEDDSSEEALSDAGSRVRVGGWVGDGAAVAAGVGVLDGLAGMTGATSGSMSAKTTTLPS